jgi:uncharacterized protein (TIGR00369 family)
MTDEAHYRKLEKMYLSAPCNEYYAPRISISEARAEILISIQKKFFHTGGAAHGTVYFKALDDATFFAVNSLVKDVLVLTVNFTLYLTRPVSEGEIKSVGKVVHASKNLFIAEGLLSDAKGREIGRGTGSFMKGNVKLCPEVGYG